MSDDPFGPLYARGGASEAASGRAWTSAMLEVEAALARACASEGEIPAAAAEAVTAACRSWEPEPGLLAQGTASSASPVVALVNELRRVVGEEAAPYVHWGATSQDVLDTAAMLVAHRALGPTLEDAAAAATAIARLADEHRSTPMAGRTLLQQALPTSFGLHAAGWLVGLDDARGRLAEVRERDLAVQMGGPVGKRDPGVAEHVARELGLANPTLPWHATRVRTAALAGGLATLAGVAAKIARDVTLMAQTEVGEISERAEEGRGTSSAMPHKRNPVAAVAVIACSARVPGLAATIHGGMAQEHGRAAGAWQAEWGTLSDLLALTGSALAWLRELLDRLVVHPDRMRRNLALLAEAGVTEAARPEEHLGAAEALVERALSARRAAGADWIQ